MKALFKSLKIRKEVFRLASVREQIGAVNVPWNLRDSDAKLLQLACTSVAESSAHIYKQSGLLQAEPSAHMFAKMGWNPSSTTRGVLCSKTWCAL